MFTRHGNVTNAQLRLRCIGLGHHVHTRVRVARPIERLFDRRCFARPVTKIIGSELQGSIDGDVTNHHQCGRIWSIVLLVKAHDFGAIEFLN